MNLDKAILIATKAHQNQVDKAGNHTFSILSE